ncbi:MAG: LPS export ABC transporter periplasmic protein LptC [Syntrophothermus sp.]
MNRQSFSRYLLYFILLTFFFSGCGKDKNAGLSLLRSSNGPVMSAKNVVVIFSDSGRVQAKLTGKIVNRYQTPEPFTEFPEGFSVVMFDSAMRVNTTITGNYGKRREYYRIMEARGNVVVRNELENKQLNTEKLVWDEGRHLITSDVPVKITTPDMVLYGDGLESNETFSRYNIKNPHGQMMVKKDSI